MIGKIEPVYTLNDDLCEQWYYREEKRNGINAKGNMPRGMLRGWFKDPLLD